MKNRIVYIAITISLLAFLDPHVLKAADPDDLANLVSQHSCPGCDLSGANLQNLNLIS